MFKVHAPLQGLSRNLLVTLGTALTVFCVTLLAHESLNRLLAQRHLAQQAEAMLAATERTLGIARKELTSLPAPHELGCQDGLSTLLAQRSFDSPELRWIAVEERGQLICRSHVVGLHWQGSHQARRSSHPLNQGWSIDVMRTPGQGQGLFMFQDRGAMRYGAALEMPRLDAPGNPPCDRCLAHELVIEGLRPLKLASSPLREDAVLEHEVRRTHPGQVDLRLKLTATADYMHAHRLQGWLVASMVALIAACLSAWWMHRLLRMRGSLDFLLKEALRQGAFVPYYQPIVDARDGRLVGAEALLRWITPDGKVVPPGQFIPHAEESGLIQPITLKLTEQVVSDVSRLKWAGSDRFISINLVPEQLETADYLRHLQALTDQHGVSPSQVSVEITERRQFEDMAAGRRVLEDMVQAGFEVKLDDAGTGFGGFSYVQELPIGTLKIDKMFVDTLRSGQDAKRPVLDAIVEFARISRLKTIAEGVETEDQVRQLAALGVHAIQGYVFGKPMPFDEFKAWAERREGRGQNG